MWASEEACSTAYSITVVEYTSHHHCENDVWGSAAECWLVSLCVIKVTWLVSLCVPRISLMHCASGHSLCQRNSHSGKRTYAITLSRRLSSEL
jgi:hypothetical protein